MGRVNAEGATRRDVLVTAITTAIARPVAEVADPGPSWRSLVRLFSILPFADTDDIWAGAEASFGWMPSILYDVHEIDALHRIILDVRERVGTYKIGAGDFDADKAAEFRRILAGVNNAWEVLTSLEITAGRGSRHHSVTGTTKFLHFLAPHVAPIYDSRVGETLGNMVGKKAWHEELKRPDGYLDYVGAVHEVATKVQAASVSLPEKLTRALVASNQGREVPLVRQIEFALYYRPPT